MLNKHNKNIIKQVLFLWLFWLIITLLSTSSAEHLELFLVRNIFSLFCFAIIIIVNVNYLIPLYFIKKKYLIYGLGSIITVIITLFLVYYNEFPWGEWHNNFSTLKYSEFKPEPRVYHIKWLPRLAPLIIGFLGSSVIEIMQYANKKENEFIEAEKENLKTELKFLKSQVNPHFLFNALNNIYSLSVIKSDQTSESIMQLSEMLRYMVYDSREAKVALKSEINYINNFIELIKLKDSRGLDIKVDVDIDYSETLIAPLLFIPFIENAFKHSKIESLKNGYVNIQLKATKEEVQLHVINSIPESNFTKDQIGGVGLENTKKRLALLYPKNQHQLKISSTNNCFDIILKIKPNE